MIRTATDNPQHVVAADDFHRLMYGLRRDASDTLRAAVRTVADSVRPDYRPTDDDDGSATARRDADTLAGEVFARLHDADKVDRVAQPAGRAWERRVHDVLDGNDTFRQLCADVSGDVDFAALALSGVLGSVAEQVGDLLGGSDDDQDDSDDGDQGQPGQGQPGQGAGAWGVSPADALDAALAVACDQLRHDLEDTREAMHGLAPGLAATPQGQDQGDPRRMLLAERLRDDDDLRDVLRKAGRLNRIHARSRKTRSDGFNEVVDVERGGDLSRVLPHTLALLDDPDLGDAALADVAQRRALQFALGGQAPLGRGPIVALRDVSGSMYGDPHAWAAAVCILSAQVADRERRQLTVVNYNGGVSAVWRMDTAGRAYRRDRNDWKPIGKLAELVLDVASCDTDGGTVLDPALEYAIDHCDLMADRADLLLVTDGRADHVRPDVLERLVACKAQGLQVSGLVINGGRLTPMLAQVCDSTVDLDRDGDTATQAAGAVRL